MSVVEQETNEEYHADTTHVSSSMLKALAESPRVFEASYITQEIKRTPTPSMEFGTAVHCCALEPDEWDSKYPTMPAFEDDPENVTAKGARPKSPRATSYYKERVAQWQADNAGAIVLSRPERERVYRCLFALRSIPLVKMMLNADGLVEHSIRYQDSLTGTKCKVRTDKVLPEKRFILDIKTIDELTERNISKACENYRYHIQDAHYRTGWATETGTDVDDWKMIFAFVETKQPYRSRAVVLDWESQAKGMELRQSLLSDFCCRMESGDWSEHGENELKEITLPSVWRDRRNG